MTSLFEKDRGRVRLVDNDMLLIVEERIRGGMCQAVYRYAKANNKYIKIMIKALSHHCVIMSLNANNLYGWAMYQNLPVNNFKWIEDISKFNKTFIKNCNENSDEGYILEVGVKYPKE